MAVHCPKCGSTSVRTRGFAERKTTGEKFQRCRCDSCSGWFQIAMSPPAQTGYQIEFDDEPKQVQTVLFEDDEYDEPDVSSPYPVEDEDNLVEDGAENSWFRDDQYISEIKSFDRLVITSAQNNTEVNQKFLAALENYCSENNARLIIIPTKLKINGDSSFMSYDEALHPYLVDNEINFSMQRLTILGSMKIIPTARNPLAGKDARSKGDSLIFGHPQYQMRTLARGMDRKYPPILSTTGSVTLARYSNTNAGDIAKFNHAFGAVVIELTKTDFFIRNLNWDETESNFYDLDKFYTPTNVGKTEGVTAIITGDSHVMFHDEEVYGATFGTYGLVQYLRPEFLVRHDILDFHSRSHHGKDDPFLEYSKAINGHNTVESEIEEVVEFLNNTTPSWCTNLIVCSNHDTHLDTWVTTGAFVKDALNAKIGHYISYKKYEYMDNHGGKSSTALAAYCDGKLDSKAIFLKEMDTFKLHGIELAFHGHNGLNGSRGSAAQFARMPDKMVVGHSHTPQVDKGCYQVGTSSIFQMGYVKSPSSWDHVHCIIYPNGKRQMIHLRNGKFRR